MLIDGKEIKIGANIWYSKEFMDTLESHVTYFRNSNKTSTVQVDPRKAVVYAGDFYGYLNDANIDQQYHWFIMRLNYMYCSSDFDNSYTKLYMPDKMELEQIRSAHTATGAMTLSNRII